MDELAATFKEVSHMGSEALVIAFEEMKCDQLVDLDNFTYCLKHLKKFRSKIPQKKRGRESEIESPENAAATKFTPTVSNYATPTPAPRLHTPIT